MIATVIASVITQQVTGQSFFTWQLKRLGITVRGGNEIGLLRNIKVAGVTDATYETVEPDTPIPEVRVRLQQAPWGELFVVDGSGRLAATITFADLAQVAFDTSRDDSLVAADVARRPAALQAHDDLETAIQKFGASGEAHVAVVDGYDSMRMLGVAHEHEVMLAYRRAIEQARAEERGEA
jgi:CIC family chloride channel protein